MFWSETPLHTHPTSHIKEQRWDWKKKPRGMLSYPKRKTRGNLKFFIECYVKVPNCLGKNQKPNQREQLSTPGVFFFFLPHSPAGRILVPQPGRDGTRAPALEAESYPLDHQEVTRCVFSTTVKTDRPVNCIITQTSSLKKTKLQKLAEQSRNLAHLSTPHAACLHSGGKDGACRVMRASW